MFELGRENTEDEMDANEKRVETCQSIDWYKVGETRVVEVAGVWIEIRFVGRKGPKGRIAITAPPGTQFRSQ